MGQYKSDNRTGKLKMVVTEISEEKNGRIVATMVSSDPRIARGYRPMPGTRVTLRRENLENYKHYRAIVGIDPDVDKSGVAFIAVEEKQIRLLNLTFPELVEMLYEYATDGAVLIVTEASWKRKLLNWHTKRTSAFVSYSVGRNHQTGILIGEVARHYGLDVIETEPLQKCWKGKDGKITHEELMSHIKQYGLTLAANKTNQETRDAVMIALSKWEWRRVRIAIKDK